MSLEPSSPLRAAALALVAAMNATGCTVAADDADTANDPEDRDGDGFTVTAGDCDDANRTIHPGAREVSFDGVDSNCDGDELPKLGEDRFSAALGIVDTDKDGAISLEEFEAACARSARLSGDARPGVVATHASCAGTNECRGMQLHPWGELREHDCAGVNACTGWSCTETAKGEGRAPEVVLAKAGCNNCHSGKDGAFMVLAAPGTDPAAAVAAFPKLSDRRMLSSIAFGIAGIGPTGVAYRNMPGHYRSLSRAEMLSTIGWLRKAPLEGKNFEWADGLGPVKK
jgi:hypothetical protein